MIHTTDRAWTWLSRASVRSPRRVLAVAALLIAVIAPGALRVTMRTDGLALVPPRAPAIETDREIRERFGVADQIVVVVETRDPRGIYNPKTLRRISELTELLARLPGLEPGRVDSLANEGSDRVYTGTLTFRPWLDPIPTTDEELAKLRRDLTDTQIYTGTLISDDTITSAAAIVVDVDRNFDRGVLYGRIRDAVTTDGESDDRTFVVGAPVAESQLGDHLLADLATLIPISGLVLVLVFYATFRSWALVLLPMAEVAASLIFTFSLMGWFGVPLYLTVAVVPVILTMIGVTDDLHIFTHLLPRLRAGGAEPQPDAVMQTMEEMAAPVSKASLTTAIGFLSFTASSIVPVSVFGLFMAIGVVFSALWSLTVMPAALALIPAARLRPLSTTPAAPARSSRLEAFARWVLRRRAPILVASLALVVAAPFGVSRVQVQDSWIDGFAPASDFRRGSDEVDRRFGGTHVLRIAFDADGVESSRRLLQPDALELIGEFERFLTERRTEGVGRVLGPYEHLTTMRYMLSGRRDGERHIPREPERMLRVVEHYRSVRGDKRLREVFDPTFNHALATVFLKHANFVDTAHLMAAVRDYEREKLAPHGITLRFAGDVAASQAMIEAIVGTQVSSVLLSLVGIAALTCLLFRSVVWGLLCVVPAALGVLGVFAAMGWTGMPLGVATSMFAATVLCIGDDYAIHLLEAARRMLRGGRTLGDALVEAVTVTAPAILIDGLAIAAAFGVLCLSRVPPNARLGGLVVVSILVCLATTLGILPALVGSLPQKLLEPENESDVPPTSGLHHSGPAATSFRPSRHFD